MTPEEFKDAIEEAVSKLDKRRATQLCGGLVDALAGADTPFPLKPAKRILGSLRRKRYFDLMRRVADALIDNGQDHAQIRRQYAQAVIDSGEPSLALTLLKQVADDPGTPSSEVAEAWGLIGRVHKQVFVDRKSATPAKKHQMLEKAIESYQHVYAKSDTGEWPDENLWHGINLVALLARAARDGIPVSSTDDYREIAKHIRDTIEEKDDGGKATLWDYGTAMEASVALVDAKEARGWAEKYVGKGPDAFELNATLRQLDEVWNLTEQDEIAQDILPLLKAELLAAEDGSVSLSPAEFNSLKTRAGDKNLEKVFGSDSYKRIKWLQLALDSCQAIGLVATRTGEGLGTGFVVNGRSLADRLDDDWYFLTNSHVVTNDAAVIEHAPPRQKPLRPDDAYITFEILFDEQAVQFTVEELVWTSPPNELDATLLRLKPRFYEGEKVKPYQIKTVLPAPDENPRIYVAGHPGGRSLTISLHDNHLLGFDEHRMQYRTPTNPGSSGSPVFNEEWQLVGLHHAGSAEARSLTDPSVQLEANEGIRIGAIAEAIRKAVE